MPRSQRGRGGRPPRYDDGKTIVVRCGRCDRRLGALDKPLPGTGFLNVSGSTSAEDRPLSVAEQYHRGLDDGRRRWRCGGCGADYIVLLRRVGPVYHQAVADGRRELVLGVDLYR